jgi:hypothetical protein
MTPYELLKLRAFGIVGGERIGCTFPGCSVSDIDALHLDHIDNDGCEHRRKTQKAGGVHTYRWVVNNPELARKKLQILCAVHDRLKARYGSVEAIQELYRRRERDAVKFKHSVECVRRYREGSKYASGMEER